MLRNGVATSNLPGVTRAAGLHRL